MDKHYSAASVGMQIIIILRRLSSSPDLVNLQWTMASTITNENTFNLIYRFHIYSKTNSHYVSPAIDNQDVLSASACDEQDCFIQHSHRLMSITFQWLNEKFL
jgi:hypothetical protein